MLDDRDSSYEISPLNRIKDEYPFFIIEIEGEPSGGSKYKMRCCPHIARR